MSRPRTRRPSAATYPPQLAAFNVDDWWLKDPDDPIEVGYARIRWTVARRAYVEGHDWESYLLKPAWWASRDNR
jgi:hypothetical protein